ncbi:DUF222 domain-containing protein [Frankia sp. AgB1.8]|uniref:HNH endonuclease signature motif containing protein n=1 Tax=Frankia sp. AgB1.8 TaxID=2792839 RepID=UPI0027DE606B|nr:DUF222 domain-containing protein [Frankia sp. AgB1.8]
MVDASIDAALARLAGSDPAGTLALVSEIARMTARLQGLMIHAQVHLARLRPPPRGDWADPSAGPYSEFAADELAAELGQSPRAQSDRLSTAWDTAHHLPGSLAALTAGTLDYPRLAALQQLTMGLSDGQRSLVEDTMLAGSRLKSTPQWRRKIRRLIAKIAPEALARRRAEAHSRRAVSITPLDDGMALLEATLAAEDARAVFDRIDSLARASRTPTGRTEPGSGTEEHRPLDARRADVLAALLLGNRREYVTVELQVIAPVGTLAGLDDNPAELVGYGPIPANVGRALASDAHWRRVLTDPESGTVLDLGHRRIPTPALARLVRHRQGRCVFPGCGMPATQADIDHTVAHAAGGRTALDNLGLLCRHHHRAKHAADGWRLDQPSPGIFRWTSPSGRTYTADTTTNDEEAVLPWEHPRPKDIDVEDPSASPASLVSPGRQSNAGPGGGRAPPAAPGAAPPPPAPPPPAGPAALRGAISDAIESKGLVP